MGMLIEFSASEHRLCLPPSEIKRLGVLFSPILVGANIFPLSVDFTIKQGVIRTFTNVDGISSGDISIPLNGSIMYASEIIIKCDKNHPNLRGLIRKMEFIKNGEVGIIINDEEYSVQVECISSGRTYATKAEKSHDVIGYYISDAKYTFINTKTNKYPKLESIGGYKSQITEIKKLINLHFSNSKNIPRGILVYGTAGVGKTTICQAIITSAHYLVEYSSSSPFQESPNSILFIDDVDLIPSAELIKKLDTSEIFVIATTNKLDSIDMRLRRRFMEIEIEIPDPKTRAEILHKLVNINDKEDELLNFALSTHGYVASDLVALVREARLSDELVDQMQRMRLEDSTEEISIDHLKQAKAKIRPSAMKEIQLDIPNVRFDDIGGNHSIKQSITETILTPLKSPSLFSDLGISPPKGILLYGPPGCSKTLLAKALATEAQLNFFAIKGPEIFNMYVGESERTLRELFKKARLAKPSIVFIDEIDSIAVRRSDGGVQERVLTTLLNEMDGIEELNQVTIVGATNRPDVIDDALMRPGRLDRILYVPPPDYDARKEIFDIQRRRSKWKEDVNVEELAVRTDKYTGAEVVNLCREAAMSAIREKSQVVMMCHFEDCLKKIKPRLSKEQMEFYEGYSARS